MCCFLSNTSGFPPESAFQERNMFLLDNFTHMTSTNKGHGTFFQQSSIDHSSFCHGSNHLNNPSFSSGQRYFMVELLPNSFGLFSQYPSSSNITMSSRQLDSQQSIAYAPPLPQKLLKPLKAYHYYYRVERDNIVKNMAINSDQIPESVHDYSESKLRELLDQRWYVDPNKKRRAHRNTLGKFGLEK